MTNEHTNQPNPAPSPRPPPQPTHQDPQVSREVRVTLFLIHRACSGQFIKLVTNAIMFLSLQLSQQEMRPEIIEKINYLNQMKLQFMKETEIFINDALNLKPILRFEQTWIDQSLFFMKHRAEMVKKEEFHIITRYASSSFSMEFYLLSFGS